jgi:uncharacterized hydrophobic protein (TIGR00271 family)
MDEQSGHTWGIDFRRNEGQRLATRQTVSSGAALTRSYLAMNAAATLIAGFGLLQNSPAVIIGAMLIAMLFGPIVGIAMGLAEANLPLLGRSFVSEIAGIAWVLAIGYAVGKAFAGIPIGSEILSRTSPTSLDLLIGLVGGLAGGFTYVAAGLTSAIVGVAIATALVPPLTSCGILLAHHLPELAAGAFLLFLANFTAIASGAMIAFWLAGHRPAAADLRKKVLLPRLISFLLLVVLGAHLTLTLRQTITHSALQSAIRNTLSSELTKMPGTRLVSVTLAPQQAETIAWVVLRTPQPVSPEQAAHLNDMVNRAAGRTIGLHIRSVITAETTREGYVYAPQLSPAEDPGAP